VSPAAPMRPPPTPPRSPIPAPSGAAEVYHAIAGREELNEEAQRRLMLSWARAGDRIRALRHYERLVATLRDVLDAEPEPETVRVYESLKAATVA
jgi:DNA-binding SARP family transcriptional activator